MTSGRYQPVDAAMVPRFAGVATFMRLPLVSGPEGLDIALYGIPWDGGTTNRAGARHGPREVRSQSSLMRRVHHVSGTEPFSLARVADIGDVSVNPIDLADGLARIQAGVQAIVAAGAVPLGIGGDHLTTLPVLRAVARDRPVGLIHFDAHSDTNDTYFGDNRYTHGTPFRRAIEEQLLDPKRCIQIGIRGSIYDPGEHDWARQQGIRILYMEDFVERGPATVMAEARQIVGTSPTYVSFDIDSIDPAMAPGTGTPEIGGLTTREAQQMLRLLEGSTSWAPTSLRSRRLSTWRASRRSRAPPWRSNCCASSRDPWHDAGRPLAQRKRPDRQLSKRYPHWPTTPSCQYRP